MPNFGVDPTSPDIPLGHCVVLTKLRAFQDAGHIVVLIIGDYTALVGRPQAARTQTRPVLTARANRGGMPRPTSTRPSRFSTTDRTELRRNLG